MAKRKHPAGAYLTKTPQYAQEKVVDKDLALTYTPMKSRVGTGGAVLATEDYVPICTENGVDIGV